ncbi:2-carboxy-1,4-naphthoquinone phytyltransferase, chloroplastic [Andrographis paniculata]|uniref:2-carboxy-1,4-naphthoquinone phytyltransferase, chloroplastic n=1 Tax=Andrographis paniculata TaxID=175694 RepID=UPI0021E8E4D8|nr:2-carboxy-1,4-naphthoquinone phytyltransferase, chloroplastic [Andrographis paniculata]
MAAAAALCSASHGCGSEKLRQYLIPRHSFTRICQVESLSFRRQSKCAKMYSNKISISELHSTQILDENVLNSRDDISVEQEKGETLSKATLIWRAIKLPMYSVALIPIMVGSAAAYLKTGEFFGNRFVLLLVSSVLVMAWVNLSNDVYDFDAGADKNKKESVVNLLGSREGTTAFAWTSLALGFIGLVWVSVEARSLRAMFLLTNAILCGYVYQCPPFRLGYLGIGEPLCFAAFGPFATIAFYFLQRGSRELSVSGAAVSSSILVGFTTTLILFCSHFHQIEDDKSVGKYSPLVRIGTERGAGVVNLAVIALYLLLFILGIAQTLPFSSVVLCALTLPVGNSVSRFVKSNHTDKTKIFAAKYFCVRLHTVFGAALAAGLVAARMFARKKLPHAILL